MSTAPGNTHVLAGTPVRTLSIGGATYDIFVTMDEKAHGNGHAVLELPIGAKIGITSVRETCGGGALNSSVSLSRLGCDARFCGIVAEDQWGQRMLDTLAREGVNTKSVTIVERETTGFSIILLLPTGERTILNHPGTNDHLHDVTADIAAMHEVDAVYLNRLSENGCMIENDIIDAFEQSPHLHLTWNPGGTQIAAGMYARDKAALLRCTNLLLLNKEEAFAFSDTTTIRDALRALSDAGAQYVCITDGGEGSYATDGTLLHHCTAPEGVRPLDTTGAGDAFGSAATWALLQKESLPTALLAGTLNAVSVIGAVGAQAGLLTETDIRDRMRDAKIHIDTTPLSDS